ncbi:HTTM domain-containing protein [Flexithrix dorotheae]|uniref:HTTM domain-containing protein n=1 Tax=Flexithrix dorotheae TaxID=70993 RepID=UPI00047651FF|nr:HTTM domain-containing protein [Flexithrix dorotheae]
MRFFNSNYFLKSTKAAPFAVFRIFFGFLMAISLIRFWALGWIDKLYISPSFHFSYYGFEFVKPLGEWTYLLFLICGISAVSVGIGYRYRPSIILFFLSFTYIELMDKTTYLNHYYFISLVAFVLIFLPANAYFSVDAKRQPKLSFEYVPSWSIDTLRLLVAIVYFYAGLAKLNSDWLIQGMPLKIWLPAHYDLPILGKFFHHNWLIYFFSWSGAIFDLSIPFLLLIKRTRTAAFVLVVIFHMLTWLLFPIGMFPFVMILAVTIFFDAKFHDKLVSIFSVALRIDKKRFDNQKVLPQSSDQTNRATLLLLSIFFVFQLAFPFRHLAYSDELFWTEEGYRFSWRVMLMEKTGYASFKIKNSKTGEQFYVNNADFLTSFQEKQMATQPDFILEYAHYLKNHFEHQGHENLAVYVESYVALNGRGSTLFIDPSTNLVDMKESWKHKTWILPFNDEIKGL